MEYEDGICSVLFIAVNTEICIKKINIFPKQPTVTIIMLIFIVAEVAPNLAVLRAKVARKGSVCRVWGQLALVCVVVITQDLARGWAQLALVCIVVVSRHHTALAAELALLTFVWRALKPGTSAAAGQVRLAVEGCWLWSRFITSHALRVRQRAVVTSFRSSTWSWIWCRLAQARVLVTFALAPRRQEVGEGPGTGEIWPTLLMLPFFGSVQ